MVSVIEDPNPIGVIDRNRARVEKLDRLNPRFSHLSGDLALGVHKDEAMVCAICEHPAAV